MKAKIKRAARELGAVLVSPPVLALERKLAVAIAVRLLLAAGAGAGIVEIVQRLG
jgi:hypothetical protein